MQRILAAVALSLCTLAAPSFSSAAPGELDPAFGAGGIARISASLTSSTVVVATARQADGKILVAAEARLDASTPKRAMVGRFDADGGADASFGIDGWVALDVSGWNFSLGDVTVLAIAPAAGGKILVAVFTPGRRVGVARLGPDGKLDPDFSFGRIAEMFWAAGTVRIAEQPDGGVIVASSENASGRSYVEHLSSRGWVDTLWGQNAAVPVYFPSGSGMINALHVGADGSVYVGGWTSTTYAADVHARDFAIVKLTPNGRFDAQFGSSGFVRIDVAGGRDEIAALVEDASSRIVAVGKVIDAWGLDPSASIGAVRLDASSGALDPTFGAGGKMRMDVMGIPQVSIYGAEVSDAQLASDGLGILVAGMGKRNDPSTPTTVSFITRIDPSGQPVTGFGVNGSIVSPQVFEFSPVGDAFAGIAVQGGIITALGTRRMAAEGSSPNSQPRGFALRQRFAESNGSAQGEAAMAQAINALGAVAVRATTLPDGRTLLVGSVGDMARVTRLRADGSLDVDFRNGGHFDFQVADSRTTGRAIAVDSSGRILVASIVRLRGIQDIWQWSVTRWTADGFPDTSYDTTYPFAAVTFWESTSIAGVIAQPDGKVLVAGAGDRAIWMSRFNGDGSPDASFSGGRVSARAPSAIEANAVAMQPDGSILVAATVLPGSFNPYPDLFLPRFTPSGARDSEWMGELTRSRRQSRIAPQSMAVQADGKVLVGGDCFSPFDQQQHPCIVLLQPNGLHDYDWEFRETIPNLDAPHVTGVGFMGDGSVVAGGDFGAGYPFAVRLTRTGSLDPDYNGTGIARTTQVQSGDWIANVIDAEGRVRSLGYSLPWSAREELLVVQFQGGVLPETSITLGVAPVMSSPMASFYFRSPDPVATFECSLDGSAFTPCSSGIVYWTLGEGDHVFQVRAVNAAGADRTPAEARWRIDMTDPETTITSAPDENDNSHTFVATFVFSSNEAEATFECSLDAAEFTACASPLTYTALPKDKHTFAVRARDAARNLDKTPATYAWKSH